MLQLCNIENNFFYYSHFSDEEIRAHKDLIIHPGSHDLCAADDRARIKKTSLFTIDSMPISTYYLNVPHRIMNLNGRH